MNPIYQSLINRKSTRVFEAQAVPQHMQHALFQAAFEAPTAGNQMLYSILHITDQDLKEKLAHTCDEQAFIASAPFVVIFLADCRRWLKAYQYAGLEPRAPGVGDLLLAIQDAVIAAQNMVVAAESFGLGSCYIGDILENAEDHIEMLKLEPYIVPISMLVIGYATSEQEKRPKPKRFGGQYIVHQNTYRALSEQEHRQMFIDRAGQQPFDYETYIEKFCNRKYMSDFSVEMSRSSLVYLKQFIKE